MIKQIKLDGMVVEYDLQYKKVKNINMRIKPNGKVYVSANTFVSQKTIEDFVASKSNFILKAIDKYSHMTTNPPKQYFGEDEIREVVLKTCQKIYPYFEKLGIEYPVIKFRKMVSQWGNCHCKRGILTFNTALMYAPIDCIEYVVAHEFTHFLQPNHSRRFYEELEKIIPDWKTRRQRLKDIYIGRDNCGGRNETKSV